MAETATSQRYHETPHVENLELYRPSGFHPTHLGDRLNRCRYLVVNKPGHGTFSTVRLGEDTTTRSYVALSIQKAEDSQEGGTHNVKMLRHLLAGDIEHPGRSNVLLPLEIFDFSGPNGVHCCIVSPVQGQSLSMMTKRKLGRLSKSLPLSKAKRAVLGAIRGLAFIHQQSIVHGADLHPGNILLSLSDEVMTGSKMGTIYGVSRTVPVTTLDGMHLDESVPRYCVEEALGRLSNVSLNSGAIKISDFGCAFFVQNPPLISTSSVHTLSLRGPAQAILVFPAAYGLWAAQYS